MKLWTVDGIESFLVTVLAKIRTCSLPSNYAAYPVRNLFHGPRNIINKVVNDLDISSLRRMNYAIARLAKPSRFASMWVFPPVLCTPFSPHTSRRASLPDFTARVFIPIYIRFPRLLPIAYAWYSRNAPSRLITRAWLSRVKVRA